MRIWVQKSASIQRRTSRLKFGHFAEKSGLNSVPNFSTKVLGWTSAVAAYGAAVFPAVFGAADDKGLVLYLFAFYYFTCLLVNWYFYYEGLMRPGKAPRPC